MTTPTISTRPSPPCNYSLDNGHGRPTHLFSTLQGKWITTPARYRVRPDGFKSHKMIHIGGAWKWYSVPSVKQLEKWSFDGVCKTPLGDMVEPDHPQSWITLLGLI